jgi:hypothetical protein
MPCVTHDLFARDTIAIGGRDKPGAQAVRAERLSQRAFQSSFGGMFEKDLAHCVSGQPGAFDHATAVDLSEQRASGDFGQFQPGFEGGDWAGIVCLPAGLAISAPSPCASVFERSMSSFRPPLVQVSSPLTKSRMHDSFVTEQLALDSDGIGAAAGSSGGDVGDVVGTAALAWPRVL